MARWISSAGRTSTVADAQRQPAHQARPTDVLPATHKQSPTATPSARGVSVLVWRFHRTPWSASHHVTADAGGSKSGERVAHRTTSRACPTSRSEQISEPLAATWQHVSWNCLRSRCARRLGNGRGDTQPNPSASAPTEPNEAMNVLARMSLFGTLAPFAALQRSGRNQGDLLRRRRSPGMPVQDIGASAR
jgi:hypothetical protein